MDTLTIVLIVLAGMGWATSFMIYADKEVANAKAKERQDKLDQLVVQTKINNVDDSLTARIDDLTKELECLSDKTNNRLAMLEFDVHRQQRTGKQK